MIAAQRGQVKAKNVRYKITAKSSASSSSRTMRGVLIGRPPSTGPVSGGSGGEPPGSKPSAAICSGEPPRPPSAIKRELSTADCYGAGGFADGLHDVARRASGGSDHGIGASDQAVNLG